MTTTDHPAAAIGADLEEAIRLCEVGEYLYSARTYSYGDGYTEPREYGIDWQWQQSKPGEYGQGALLAEAVKWHEMQAADGFVTEAAKLRAALAPSPAATGEAVPVAWQARPNEVEWDGFSTLHAKPFEGDFLRGLDMVQRPLYAHPAPAVSTDARVRELEAERDHLSGALLSVQENRDAIEASLREIISGLRAELAALRAGGK